MRRAIVLGLAFVFAMATRAQAQASAAEVLSCSAYPCAATVLWDPVEPTATEPIGGYRVRLDSDMVAPATGPDATFAQIVVPAIGLHTVAVRAFNAQGDGPEGALVFDAQLVIDTPAPQTAPTRAPVLRIRVSVVGATGTAPTSFVLDGRTWSLERVADGRLEIRRDGVPAPDAGLGCLQLVPVPAIHTVAAFCPDGNWWQWVEDPPPSTSHWLNIGPQGIPPR